MGFLRRLLGVPSPPESRYELVVTVSALEDQDQLAFVTVGSVRVPARIYEAYERDRGDLTSGLRLEDPVTGRWLRETEDFPDDFRAAGARSIEVVGLSHHQPDASRDDFGVGHIVRLVPDPSNPADSQAVAVRSADGRYLAGYLPREHHEIERFWKVPPTSSVGLVTWENYRPRERIRLILLVGPNIKLDVVPPDRQAAERARREAAFAAGLEAEERENERYRAEWEAHKRQVEEWRAAGRCIDCGGEIEPTGRYVRCASCRAARKATNAADAGAPAAVITRDYANTTCPYCNAKLDPLPKAKAKCPSCGQPIWVRSGPDGLTYLLQEVDLPTLEQAWQEYREAEHKTD